MRAKDYIDPGFINCRICLTELSPEKRELLCRKYTPGDDHITRYNNSHLLITILLEHCIQKSYPTLVEALARGQFPCLFRSTAERLAPCPDINDLERVDYPVQLERDFGKPVHIAYHTEHIISKTGKMTLQKGLSGGYAHALVGKLHDRQDRFEIEPLVIGAPWGELLPVPVLSESGVSMPAVVVGRGSKDAVDGAAACKDWLITLMRAGPPTQNRVEYKKAAIKKFKISGRRFDVAWDGAITETKNLAWSKPGPKSNR